MGGLHASPVRARRPQHPSAAAPTPSAVPVPGAAGPQSRPRPHRTGLPDGLREALEARSGLDLSSVRVRYDSPEPARLDALAYAQGRQIDVAPGQERHLPHEAWHVVQQLQGRARATRDQGGIPVDDDAGREREADAVARSWPTRPPAGARPARPARAAPAAPAARSAPVQLTRKHAHKMLTRYHKGDKEISDADKTKLFAVFSEWKRYTDKADLLKGATGAGAKRAKAEVSITRARITALNSAADIPIGVRRAVIDEWNRSQRHDQRVVLTLPAPAVMPAAPGDGTGQTGGTKRLWRDISTLSTDFDLTTAFGTPEHPAKRRKLTGADQSSEQVPEVGTVEDAALVIRSHQKQNVKIPGDLRFIHGSGLYEARGRQDIVYTPLDVFEDHVTRSGGVDNWTKILQHLSPDLWKDPRLLLNLLQAVLRGHQTNDQSLQLMAGAMVTDVKHGVGTWLSVLSELYPALAASPGKYDPESLQELFKQWYVYIADRKQGARAPAKSFKGEPNRSATFDWDLPTLLPRLGGYDFPSPASPAESGLTPAGMGAFDPGDQNLVEFIATYFTSQHIALEPATIRALWNLALTNKHWYNQIAALLRQTYPARQ